MTLTAKEKELAAVGMSIAAGCRPCTDYHVKAVRETGAAAAEIRDAIAAAVAVRHAATAAMEAHGLARLGLAAAGAEPAPGGNLGRVGELVSVGAALAVNCTAGLDRHLAAAAAAGVTADEVDAIATLATFIRKQAVSHVDKLVGAYRPGASPDQPAAACGCG